MDFRLTDEQQALKEMVRKFVQNEVTPVAAKYDESGEFPWPVIRKAFEKRSSSMKKWAPAAWEPPPVWQSTI